MNDLNPYRAPGDDVGETASPKSDPYPRGLLQLVASKKMWFRRELRLADHESKIVHTILYNAASNGEQVFVDGVLAATTTFWHFPAAVYPYVEFTIPHGSRNFPGRIDVYVSYLQLLHITQFKLTIGEDIIYRE